MTTVTTPEANVVTASKTAKKPAKKKTPKKSPSKPASKKASNGKNGAELSAADLRKGGKNSKSVQIAVRLTHEEYQAVLKDAKDNESASVAAWLRTSLGL